MANAPRPQPGNRVRVVLDATVVKDHLRLPDALYVSVMLPDSPVAQRLRIPLSAVENILVPSPDPSHPLPATREEHKHIFNTLFDNGVKHDDKVYETRFVHGCECGALMTIIETRNLRNGSISRKATVKEADGSESFCRKSTREGIRYEEAIIRDIIGVYNVLTLDAHTSHCRPLTRAEQKRHTRYTRKLDALKNELGRDITEEEAITLYQRYRQQAS